MEFSSNKEHADYQYKIEASIKEFIKNNQDINRIPLSVLVFNLLGGSPGLWEDQVYEMRNCLLEVTALLLIPEVMEKYDGPGNSIDLGKTMTRLLDFFFKLENTQAKAEIDLAALGVGLLSPRTLESFPMPYHS